MLSRQFRPEPRTMRCFGRPAAQVRRWAKAAPDALMDVKIFPSSISYILGLTEVYFILHAALAEWRHTQIDFASIFHAFTFIRIFAMRMITCFFGFFCPCYAHGLHLLRDFAGAAR